MFSAVCRGKKTKREEKREMVWRAPSCGTHFCIKSLGAKIPLNMSLRSMVKADCATLLGVTFQRLEGMMDAKFADQEGRFAVEISTPQKRIEQQLEPRARDRTYGNDEPAVQEAKRPRKLQHRDCRMLVFSGFPDRTPTLCGECP